MASLFSKHAMGLTFQTVVVMSFLRFCFEKKGLENLVFNAQKGNGNTLLNLVFKGKFVDAGILF